MTDLSITNAKSVVTDHAFVYNYDMGAAPIGKKLILLTVGGVAIFGQVSGRADRDSGFKAWAPLPVEDKAKERERERLQVRNS